MSLHYPRSTSKFWSSLKTGPDICLSRYTTFILHLKLPWVFLDHIIHSFYYFVRTLPIRTSSSSIFVINCINALAFILSFATWIRFLINWCVFSNLYLKFLTYLFTFNFLTPEDEEPNIRSQGSLIFYPHTIFANIRLVVSCTDNLHATRNMSSVAVI